METRTEQVIDICDAFRLEATEPKQMDKKVYKTHLKSMHAPRCFPSTWTVRIADLSVPLAYMKKVTEKMKERGADEAAIKDFQSAAQKYSAKILSNWDNYDTYTGASQDPDGMYV